MTLLWQGRVIWGCNIPTLQKPTHIYELQLMLIYKNILLFTIIVRFLDGIKIFKTTQNQHEYSF